MPIRHAAIALLSGALLLLPARAGAASLRVSGTGTGLGAMRLLADAFHRAHPDLRLEILTSVGSGGAFSAVAKGALDVGLSARPLRPEEYGLGLVTLPYARTPFLFATGPRAGATDLTLAQAVRIYRGEVTTWPNGERLRLVLRPRNDADTQILRSISPELAAASDAALARPGMLVATSNQESNEILVRTPGSLGLTSLTQVTAERLAVTPLSWSGVAPTLANMESGAYPLVKTLYLVVRAPAPPAVRRFVAFMGSAEARRILEAAGSQPLPLPPLE